MKTIKRIPFSDLENIPSLIKDFLSGNLVDFQTDTFTLENFKSKIRQKETYFSQDKRTNLTESFTQQLKFLELSEIQNKNLALLKAENTFTITTGHQLNLFSGPVFFIYKILQTIKTAEYLSKQFSEYHFVPIFWMATEDHDFEEINHFNTDSNFYRIEGHSGGVVGKIKPENFDFIAEFEQEYKNYPFGEELISLLKESYTSENNLTEATRFLVQSLFSDFGLLMIDGDDADLKKLMISTFEDELQNQSLKKNSVKKVEFLEEKYGKVQVNPRDINLFYLTETRNRIEFQEDHYQIIDTDITFTKEELLKELQNFPEKFSPNALMRPVFQESILPNIAYIGGNAEIMYWLELKDYFEQLELPFPVLIPRNSFLMLNEKTVEKMDKLSLNIEDFFSDFRQLSKDILLKDHEISEQLDELELQLKSQFSIMKVTAEKTDITFGNLVDAEETRQLKSFNRMKKRLLRAEKVKQQELLERLENLFQRIHPSGIWQERVCNFSVFYAAEGESWLQFCLKEMSVENPELVIAVV